jgi:hypothetical protein
MGVAIVLSAASHTPDELPSVALASEAVLYVEKAVALFVAFLLAFVVIVRSFAGELPTEIRGLKYELNRTKSETAVMIDELAEANLRLRRRVEHLESRDPSETRN